MHPVHKPLASVHVDLLVGVVAQHPILLLLLLLRYLGQNLILIRCTFLPLLFCLLVVPSRVGRQFGHSDLDLHIRIVQLAIC